jgi:hypothetical protein
MYLMTKKSFENNKNTTKVIVVVFFKKINLVAS